MAKTTATLQSRDTLGNINTDFDRSEVPAKQEPRMVLRCNECGKKFKTTVFNTDVECPKCGGVDYEEL